MIEAGPRDTNPFIHMPVGFFRMTAGPLTWGYGTVPLRHTNNRTAVYPQARVLGGGSSINAEIYTRGCPEDYDGWASRHGCDGWDWNGIKPYFVKSEGNTRLGGPGTRHRDHHGGSGKADQCGGGSHCHRRGHRLAETSHAVGHRPRGSLAGSGCCRRP